MVFLAGVGRFDGYRMVVVLSWGVYSDCRVDGGGEGCLPEECQEI